jgi:hypothetical protein
VRRLKAEYQLYHYALTSQRQEILNNGIEVDWIGSGYISCGLTPREAWDSTRRREGRYDLWQITRDETDEIRCRKDNGLEILEVKIFNDIPLRRVWLGGAAYRGNLGSPRR